MSNFIYSEESLANWAKETTDKPVVILVDFFDTLLIRKIPPVKVFKRVNPYLALFRQFTEFVLQRFGRNRNPTIQQITRWIPFWTVRNEIDLEIEVLIPNLPLLDELQTLSDQNINIYIVSDTYYSSSEISHILDQFHCFKPREIFTSSERGISKGQGLYEEVIKNTKKNNHKIVIVGDDLKSDGVNAMRNMINFFWVITSVDDSNIVKIVHPEDFAAASLGKLVRGFSFWLSSEIDEYQPELVCFLSRDSLILKYNWDILNSNGFSSTYLPASRKVAIESGFGEKIPKNLHYLGQKGEMAVIKNMQGRDDFVNYYTEHFGVATRIAIIDLGWNGTFQDALTNAFPLKNFKGFYLGILPHNVPDKNKTGFLFEPGDSSRAIVKDVKRCIDVLEVVLCSGEGSLMSLKDGVQREKIALNDNAIKMVQDIFYKGLTHASILDGVRHSKDEIVADLTLLGRNAPDWFIKSATLIRHKISPFATSGQPLFVSSFQQIAQMDRVWWPAGQERFLKLLKNQNEIHFYICSVSSIVVQIRLTLRIISHPKDLRQILFRLIRVAHPH